MLPARGPSSGWLACVFGLGLAAGCGDGQGMAPTPAPPGTLQPEGGVATAGQGGAGAGRDAGAAGQTAADAGVDAADAASLPGDGGTPADPGLLPVVTILSPTHASDPVRDGVISTQPLTVQCSARKGPAPGAQEISIDSVAIVLFEDANPVEEPPVRQSATGDFEADFVGLDTKIDNGKFTIACSAEDSSESKRKGEAEVEVFIDFGPAITVSSPRPDSTVALTKPLEADFTVSALAVDPSDSMADVVAVSLSVAGQPIAAAESPSMPGRYTARAILDDPTVFPLLSGLTGLGVRATNKRGVVRTHSLNFHVDADGPKLEILAPSDNALMRGVVQIEIEATDAAGVNMASLGGSVGNMGFEFPFRPQGGNKYVGSFDTRQFPPNVSQITVNVLARDSVGNETRRSITLRIDNAPPVIDLDPLPVRERKKEPPSAFLCSRPFDPVGALAVDDGDVRPEASVFRARIEDRGNFAEGAPVTFLAGIDDAKVQLYVLDDSDKALLVDTDGDGICDEINPMLDPAPVLVDLAPVQYAGQADFQASVATEDPAMGTLCGPGNDSMAPSLVCQGSEMSRVTFGVNVNTTGIYARAPTQGSNTACHGDAWNFRTQISEGWACVAVRAEDTIGNVGVSAPLRVCFEHSDPNACPGNPYDNRSGIDPLPRCTAMDCTPAPATFRRIIDLFPF